MSSVCNRLGFSGNARTFARLKKLIYSLPNYKKKPAFSSLADEIAEPRPDMNIKVAALTVSEKSSTTINIQFLKTRFFRGCQLEPHPHRAEERKKNKREKD